MARKTKKMLSVEQRYNKPLEKLLPELYNEKGLPAMAAELGIGKGTIWYWMLRFGIHVHRVALAQGEELQVQQAKKG